MTTTTKNRTPKAAAKSAPVVQAPVELTPEAAALEYEQGPEMEAPKSGADLPATVVVPTVHSVAPLYLLTGKAPRHTDTPQLGGVKSGLGNKWVAAAKPAHNSRATALATLQAVAQASGHEHGAFTQSAALAALGALPKGTLGSGSPRSYWAAFLASGYIVKNGHADVVVPE